MEILDNQKKGTTMETIGRFRMQDLSKGVQAKAQTPINPAP